MGELILEAWEKRDIKVREVVEEILEDESKTEEVEEEITKELIDDEKFNNGFNTISFY